MSENLDNLETKISQIMDLIRNTKNSYDFSAETYIHILEKINNRLNDLQGFEPSDLLDLKDKIKDLSSSFKTLDSKSDIKNISDQVEYISASQQKSDKNINDFTKASYEIMQKLSQFDPSASSYVNELKLEVVNALDVIKRNVSEFEQTGIAGLKSDIQAIASLVKDSHLQLTKGAQDGLNSVVNEFRSYIDQAHSKLNSLEVSVQDSLKRNTELISQTMSEDLVGNIYVLKNAIVAIKDAFDRADADKIDKQFLGAQLTALQEKFIDLNLNSNMSISQELLKLGNGLISIKALLDSFENSNFSREITSQFKNLEKKFTDIDNNISQRLVHELASVKEESTLLKEAIIKNHIDGDLVRQQYESIEEQYKNLDFSISTTFTNEFTQLLAETLELKKSLVYLKDTQLDNLYVKEQFSSIVDKYDVLNNNISITIANEFGVLKESSQELRSILANFEENQVDRLFLQTQLDNIEQKFSDIDTKISGTISEEFSSISSMHGLIKELYAKQIDENVLKAHFDSMQEKFIDLNINTNMAISQELLKLNEEFISLTSQIQSVETKQIDKAVIQSTLESIEEKFTDLNLNINNNFFEELSNLNQQSLILREAIEGFDGKIIDKIELKAQLERIEEKYTHIDEAIGVTVNNELQQLSQDTAILKDLAIGMQDKQIDGELFKRQFDEFAVKFQEIDKNIALTISTELYSMREESTNLKAMLEDFSRLNMGGASSIDTEAILKMSQQMNELDSKIELLSKDINMNISHEISSQREYLEAFAERNNTQEPVKDVLEDFANKLGDLESGITLSISNEIMAIRQEASYIRESFDSSKDNTQIFEQFDAIRERISLFENHLEESISPQLIQLREAVESIGGYGDNIESNLDKQIENLQCKIESLEANLNTSYLLNEFKVIQDRISELDTNISLAVSHELIEVREETASIRNSLDQIIQGNSFNSSKSNDVEFINQIYEKFNGVFTSLDEIKSKYASIGNIDDAIEQKISTELALLKSQVESVKDTFNGLEAKIDDGALIKEQFDRFIDRFNQIDASVNSTISYEISQIRQDSLSVKQLLEEYQYNQNNEGGLRELIQELQSGLANIDERVANRITSEIEKVKSDSASLKGSLEGLRTAGVVDEVIEEQITMLFEKLNSISSSISHELEGIKEQSAELKTTIETHKPQDIDEVLILEQLDAIRNKFNDFDGLVNNILIEDVQKIKEHTQKLKDTVEDIKDIKIGQEKLQECVNTLNEKFDALDIKMSNEVLNDLADIKIDANTIKETTIEGFVKLQSSSEILMQKVSDLDQKLSVLDSESNKELIEELNKITSETASLKDTLAGLDLKQVDDELIKAEFKILQDKFMDIDSSINNTVSQELSQIRQESSAMKEFFEDIEFNQVDEEMLQSHFENVSERIAKFEGILEQTIQLEFSKVKQDYDYLKELVVSVESAQIDKMFYTKNFDNIKERIFDLDSKLNQRITDELMLLREDSTAVKILTENLIKSQTTTILDEFEVVRDKFTDLQVYINETESSLFEKVSTKFEDVKGETHTIKQMLKDIDDKQIAETLVEEGLANIKDRLQGLDVDINSKLQQDLMSIKEETKLVKNTLSNIEETQIDKLTIKEQFEVFTDRFNKFKVGIEQGLANSFINILSDSNALKEVFNDIEIKQFDGGFIKSQIEGVLEKFDQLDSSLTMSMMTGLDKYTNEIASIKNSAQLLVNNSLDKNMVVNLFGEMQDRINDLDASISNRILGELSNIDQSTTKIKDSLKNFDNAVENIARIEANQIDMAESLREQVQSLQEQLLVQMLQLFENVQFYDEAEEIKEYINSFKGELKEEVANLKFILSSTAESKTDFIDGIQDKLVEMINKLEGKMKTSLHDIVDNVIEAVDELQGVNKRIDEVTELAGGLETSAEALKKQVADVQASVYELPEFVKHVDSVLDDIYSAVNDLPRAAAEIQDKLNQVQVDVRNLPAATDEIQSKLEQVHTNVRDLPNVTGMIQDKLEQVHSDVRDLPAITSELQDKVDHVYTEFRDLPRASAEIQDKIEEVYTEVRNLPQMTQDIRTKLEESSSTLGQQVEDVQYSVRNLPTLVDEVKSQMADLQNKVVDIPSLIHNLDDSFSKDLKTVVNNVDSSSSTVTSINQKIEAMMQELINISKGAQDNAEYVYSLPDIEADIAKVRLNLNEITQSLKKDQDFSEDSTNSIFATLKTIQTDVENFTTAIPSVEFMKMKEKFESLNDDITSISKRTNKLIMTSDDSNRNLQANLSHLKDIARKLPDGADVKSRLDNIDKAIYFIADWVDSTAGTLNDIKQNSEPVGVDVQTLKLLINELHTKVKSGFKAADEQSAKIEAIEQSINNHIKSQNIEDRLDSIERQMLKFEKNINKIIAFIDEE